MSFETIGLLWTHYVSVEITCLYCTMFCSEIFWLCAGMLNSAELKITTQCFLRPISAHCNMRRWTLRQGYVWQICPPLFPKLALLQHIQLWDILHWNAQFSGTHNYNSVFFCNQTQYCNMQRWTMRQIFVWQICPPQSPKLALLQHILLWDILHRNAQFSGTQNHNSVFFATNLSTLQHVAYISCLKWYN